MDVFRILGFSCWHTVYAVDVGRGLSVYGVLRLENGSGILRPHQLPHFRELNGIRGIAALAVFVHHFYQPIEGGWLIHLSRYGSSGVDVLFVLSGFLITSLLLIDRNT
jgi:hypothetical protein